MNKKLIIVFILVIVFSVAIWYFSSNARTVETIPDPYAELRKTIGKWTKEDTKDYSRTAVIRQDIPEAEGDVDNWYKTFLAFNKGHNISVNAWTLRDVLKNDLIDFVETYGHMRHIQVSVGQFIS